MTETRLTAEQARKVTLNEVPRRVDDILAGVHKAALKGLRHVDVYKVDGKDLKIGGRFHEQSPITKEVVAELRKLGYVIDFKDHKTGGHIQSTETYMQVTW